MYMSVCSRYNLQRGGLFGIVHTKVLIKIRHVSFVWSKKERDARSPIYPQAAAPVHKLESLRLVSNFYMSDSLRAVEITSKNF